jgi:histone deacetylase 1/2
VCGKEGHSAVRCFKRFDHSYNGPSQKTAASATSYGVDTNWYMDTGATDHITGELEKLTMRNKYNGGEQIHGADGTGMEIANIGYGTVHSPSRNFHLKNLLHVPQAHKNLCSVNRFTRDNDVYVEFHPDHFLIKEQLTRRTLHSGRCKGGLYLLPSSPNKQALGAIKPSTSLWHHRLGHATSRVIKQVLDKHRLPFMIPIK